MEEMQLRGNEEQVMNPHMINARKIGMAIGARSAALSILQKIEELKKPNPKKSDLLATILEVKRFCRETFNIQIPEEYLKVGTEEE